MLFRLIWPSLVNEYIVFLLKKIPIIKPTLKKRKKKKRIPISEPIPTNAIWPNPLNTNSEDRNALVASEPFSDDDLSKKWVQSKLH